MISTLTQTCDSRSELNSETHFLRSGNQTFKLGELAAGLANMRELPGDGKLAFVLPGWMDDGDEDWVLTLVQSK